MDTARARFEAYLKRHFGDSSTATHYMNDLMLFTRTLGEKAPEAITAADIDTFIDSQIAAGLSPATINRRLASLHTFFEYLASEDPTRDWPNPVNWRRHRLKTGEHLPRDVPDGDVARLFAVIDDVRDQAIFGLMLDAGLRVGEVAALRLDSPEAPATPGALARLWVCGKGNKERVVWLTPSLWAVLQAWRDRRPPADTEALFLNQHGQPIGVAGIQYRFQQYCEAAGVTVTCHQLRHTFARRLAENGLPVDSLAKLLGHSQLQTTQRYISGADPSVRADFDRAIAQLETAYPTGTGLPSVTPKPPTASRPRVAPEEGLVKLCARLDPFPGWLSEAVEAYLRFHWPTWRARTAFRCGECILYAARKVWTWVETNRQVTGWETFRRADLEAWVQARCQDGVKPTTVRGELGQFRMVLQFLEARDYPIDPGLFRIKPPKRGDPLPRYLDEAAYHHLETVVFQQTESDTDNACLDRAWFLTLAHTGVRVCELLDLRLDDLNLVQGQATVRGGKSGRDRVVYLTPPLLGALERYLDHRPDVPHEDHVFLLRRRSPSARAIQRRLAKYGTLAGIHVTPHQLRHTFATRLLNRGMPIHSLRKLLGHQNLNMTQTYARVYDETLYMQFRTTMSRLEGIAVEDWPQLAPGELDDVHTEPITLDNSV